MPETVKYIVFNGPPYSGKSFAANTLRVELAKLQPQAQIVTESFAAPLKHFVAAAFSERYQDMLKDSPQAVLSGHSIRELLIGLSERFMKPQFGDDVFGRLLYHRTHRFSPLADFVICDDSGFEAELDALGKNVFLIRMTRPETNFSKDSRKFLPKPNFTVNNSGDLVDLVNEMKQLALTIMEKFHAVAREAFIQEFKEQIAQNELRWDALSSGPLHAEVVFIGEGPGETEARKHEPWVGGAGTLLWDCVRKYNLHKANVYATNVVKRQISLSRKGNEKHVVQRDELDKWIGLTRWELSRLPNVRLIFALGNYALELFAGKSSGITDWRGSVLDCTLPNGKKGSIVYSVNPAYAQRELKMEPMFRMDCNKLDRVNRGIFKSHVVEGIINPSYREARRFIADLSKSPKPVALDVEHANGETACYGLSNDPHHAMCINLRDSKKNRYTLAEETGIMMDIQNLCDSHKIIAQSGGHETYWCWLKDWLKMHVWFDTLLAHHTLYPQMPHSLGFLVSQYTNHPFYKDEGEEWKEGGDIDDWWRYNCKDAALTVAVYEKELKDLQQQGLDKFFFNHVMRAQPHLAAATVHGIAVDLSIKEKIVEMVSADVDKLLAEFHNYVYQLTKVKHYRPNPGSWQQMKELYFEVLRLKGKGASTDDTNRTHMLKNVETSPLAKEMLVAVGRWAEENKFLGTYAKAKASDDGRFRCDYKQFGVQNAPGRLSSAKLITGEGGNLQNQPVRARAMFIADSGCVFPYFDLSQAEARVVAFRANIPKWKDQFERARLDGKYDCHRALASEMFKVPYDKVPKKDWLDDEGRDENDPKCGSLKPTIRYIAKRCRHGLNYRMERFRLSEVTGLPYFQAARSFAMYHSVTPELEPWWKEEERCFRAEKQTFNALGRRLKVVQRIDDDVLKSIVAFYPQSTIGDKVTQVWYQCEEDDKWPTDARIVLDVHDCLVPMCSPKSVKTVLSIAKKYAEKAIMIQDVYKNKPEPLIIPAELKCSYPTRSEIDEDGKLNFIEDPKGFHRWSHMKAIEL